MHSKKDCEKLLSLADTLIESLKCEDLKDLPEVVFFTYKGIKVDITEDVYKNRI